MTDPSAPFDPHAQWHDKAVALLRAITAHFAPASTRLEDLADVLAVLRAKPELKAEVARILQLRWSGNSPAFDEFLAGMERAQRYDGAPFREFIHLSTSGRRPQRDGIKVAARALLQSLEP